MSSGIKTFVSEKQIEEKKKARQEEWERVRKPEDPAQAPEEEYDPRSLFERLKEQKDKKQEDFEEQLKFKNHFRGINHEESDFLQDVNKKSSELEKQKRDQEKKELEDFRTAREQSRELPEVGLDLPVKNEENKSLKKVQTVKKNPQQNILKNAVKRKAASSDTTEKSLQKENLNSTDEQVVKSQKLDEIKGAVIFPSATKCVGILPGLSAYDEESGDNSDGGSSSDDDDMISNNLLSSIVFRNNPE